MKTLIYNDVEYDFISLLKYTTDKNISHMFVGDVVDKQTGEIFDISILKNKYNEHNLTILENINHLPLKDKLKVLEWSTKGYDEIREVELMGKFENNTINAEECRELLAIQNKIKKSQVLKMRYDSFYMVNKSKDKPESLSDDYYGKFFRLIKFMSCRNRMEHIVNGKPLKKEDIMLHIGLKSSAFDTFLKKLESLHMIARGKIGKYKYIIINPAYANMQYQITFDIYNLFKADLDDLLSPIEIKLLQLAHEEEEVPILQYE